MKQIFDMAWSMYGNYNGTGMQMALFFASLLYLAVNKKEKDKRILFIGYTIAFFVICLFPVTAKIIMNYCTGAEVYWRMFWLLPTAIVTAYTGVVVISHMEKKLLRYGLLGVMLVVIVMTGTNVYNDSIFDRKQNNYKLPNDTIAICDIIEKDAAANGIDKMKLITTNDLLPSIRQYDANIYMPYGNDAVKGLRIGSNSASQIFRIMSSDTKDWESLSFYAASEGCNYLAYPIDDALVETLASYGFEKIGASAGYYVYRYNKTADSFANQWLVTQYGNKDGNQLIFYTVQNMQGNLIVVDGGWTSDADYVKSVLASLGNHVNAWILTHPHPDHIGAFDEIYKNPGRLQIDTVYAVDMAPPELCMENAKWDDVSQYQDFLTLTIPQLTYVHSGDNLDINGLKLEVLSAYDDSVDQISNDLLNDGSMMFKLVGNTQSMLFCADVGKSMSDTLLNKYGDTLKSDYIQMGHHGNGGLKRDFYEKVGAKVAFFDAPDWLMNDRSGKYTNPQTIYWMGTAGARIVSFNSTPNQVLIK